MAKRTLDSVTAALRPTDLYVLLVLEEQPLHGYGVMKAAARLSDGGARIDIGSLYRIIARMTEAGLIEDVPDTANTGAIDVDDERRRYYRITPAGRRTLKAEVVRLKSVVTLAAERGLFGTREKSR